MGHFLRVLLLLLLLLGGQRRTIGGKEEVGVVGGPAPLDLVDLLLDLQTVGFRIE